MLLFVKTARATHLKNLTNETPCWFWKPEPDGKLGEGEAMSRSRFRQVSNTCLEPSGWD